MLERRDVGNMEARAGEFCSADTLMSVYVNAAHHAASLLLGLACGGRLAHPNSHEDPARDVLGPITNAGGR
jgi:hypothetical protein